MEKLTLNITEIAKNNLTTTQQMLSECKEILSGVPPEYFMGAGLNLVSLLARQKMLEGLQEGENALGWQTSTGGWTLKHRSEVERFYDYCCCVEEMQEEKKRYPEIVRICSNCDSNITQSLLLEGFKFFTQYWGKREEGK